jgi:hypothetical protein
MHALTVTLDEDVDAMLRAEVRRTGQSVKQVVNELLRESFHPGKAIVERLKGDGNSPTVKRRNMTLTRK